MRTFRALLWSLSILTFVIAGRIPADAGQVSEECPGEEIESAVLEFDVVVEPPQPVVGDDVTLTFDVTNVNGGLVGLPQYTLSGTAPFFTGDTSVRNNQSGANDQIYMLHAAQAGTAELSYSIQYETSHGCPPLPIFSFTSSGTGIFTVEILPASPTPTPTPTPNGGVLIDSDGGCQVAPASSAGGFWLLDLAVALLVVSVRRRGSAVGR